MRMPTWLLIAACLMGLLIPGASVMARAPQPTWALEPVPSYFGPSGLHAVPLGEGGAIVGRTIDGLGVMAFHLDTEDRIHPLGLVSAVTSIDSEHDTALGPMLVATPMPIYPQTYLGCERRAKALLGRDLRMAHNLEPARERGARALDAQGRFGYLARRPLMQTASSVWSVERDEHDCNPQPVGLSARFARILHNLSDSDAAIVELWNDETAGLPSVTLARLQGNDPVWFHPLQSGIVERPIAVGSFLLADERMLVLLADPGSPRQSWQLLDSSGELLWERGMDPLDETTGPYYHDFFAVDGLVAVVNAFYAHLPWETPKPSVIRVYNEEGETVSSQPLGFDYTHLPRAPQRRSRPLLSGDGAVLQFDVDGILTELSDTSGLTALAELADGRLLLHAVEEHELVLRDPVSGVEQRLPFPDSQGSPGTSLLRGDAAGVVERVGDPSGGAYRAVDGEGNVRWQLSWDDVRAATGFEELMTGLRVTVDSQRVCVLAVELPMRRVICRDRDGESPFTVSVPVPATFGITSWDWIPWMPTAGDAWALRYDIHTRRLLAQHMPSVGETVPPEPVAGLPIFFNAPTLIPSGQHLIVLGQAPSSPGIGIWVVTLQGANFLTGVESTSLQNLRLYEVDGGWLLATMLSTQGVRTLSLIRFDATRLLWRRDITIPGQGPSTEHLRLVQRQGAWMLPLPDSTGLSLLALADSDGATRWSRHIRTRAEACLLPNREGPLAVLLQREGRLELTWHSPGDGGLLDASVVDAQGIHRCGRSYSGAAVPIGEAGVALGVSGSGGARLMRIDPPAAVTDPPDVSWLRGVWYDPASTGQGFMLQFFPQQALLSGAWFTYWTGGGHARAGQRWYTLTAPVPAGGGPIQLEGQLHETRGGRFATPPAVGSRAVGAVRLRLIHCNGALLEYEFLDGDARAGTVLLSRLVPDAANCGATADTADGSSGSFWFDPASSGQGLYLQDIGTARIGAWFTFDPEGRADDVLAQHWFTLVGAPAMQGSDSGSRILRQIGGSFDHQPTRNQVEVGSARWFELGCDRRRLEYDFDLAPWAAEFLGLSGAIDLQRIGGCAE